MRPDRRRFTRYIPPSSLVATAVFPHKPEQRLQLRNISIDGFSFTTSADILHESFFTVALEITDASGVRRIETPAKILWAAFDKGSSIYSAGAQFLKLNERDSALLEETLAALEPERSPADNRERS